MWLVGLRGGGDGTFDGGQRIGTGGSIDSRRGSPINVTLPSLGTSVADGAMVTLVPFGSCIYPRRRFNFAPAGRQMTHFRVGHLYSRYPSPCTTIEFRGSNRVPGTRQRTRRCLAFPSPMRRGSPRAVLPESWRINPPGEDLLLGWQSQGPHHRSVPCETRVPRLCAHQQPDTRDMGRDEQP